MYTQLLSIPRPIFQRQHQIIQISKSSCILKTTEKSCTARFQVLTTAEVWLGYFVCCFQTSTHDHGRIWSAVCIELE